MLETTAGAALLTAADLRAHARIDDTSEDALITSYIAAATKEAQDRLLHVFTAATWTLHLRAFPSDNVLALPRWPLAAIATVLYVDTAGGTQVMAATDYSANVVAKPATISLVDGKSWPATRSPEGGVQIICTAGFGAASSVPETFKQLVRWMAARMFEERLGMAAAPLDDAINCLIRNYRLAWPH